MPCVCRSNWNRQSCSSGRGLRSLAALAAGREVRLEHGSGMSVDMLALAAAIAARNKAGEEDTRPEEPVAQMSENIQFSSTLCHNSPPWDNTAAAAGPAAPAGDSNAAGPAIVADNTPAHPEEVCHVRQYQFPPSLRINIRILPLLLRILLSRRLLSLLPLLLIVLRVLTRISARHDFVRSFFLFVSDIPFFFFFPLSTLNLSRPSAHPSLQFVQE